MKIKAHATSNAYGGKERVGASVIAHGYPSPILDSSKHVLHFVALSVEYVVVINRSFATFPGRYAGSDSPVAQGFSKPCGIISPIGRQVFGLRQAIQQHAGSLVVAGLSGSQRHGYRFALFIANSMQFGIQPPFCTSDTSG